MRKTYLITESQFKLLTEDVNILKLLVLAISFGGLWGLADLLQKWGDKGILRRTTHLKKRLSVKDEKQILLSAYNFANLNKIESEVEKLKGMKVNFDVYCDLSSNVVGKLLFEIERATYVIDANPKNHLSSKIYLEGSNLDTGKKLKIILNSQGDDVYFLTMESDSQKFYGCYSDLIYLANEKFYEYCVKKLHLVIHDFPITRHPKQESDF